jgi:hypothetical protein
METILFLGIIICMITCILTQMIESHCILQYHMGALGEGQEFVQLPLHQSFRNMVCPEGSSKFLPGDNMAIRLHGTTKLLGGEVSFT